jgi:ribosomal protein S18 acetylase RimI-like enzyme
VVKLEQLGPDDWEEFRDLRLRALGESPEAFGMTLIQARRNSEEHWRGRLTGGAPIMAVRVDGALVSMGGGWVAPGDQARMTVWGMWTAPESRGKGHSRALLCYLLNWASQRDITTVELHVTEGNDVARRFYEQCGFEATGQWEPLREGSDRRKELMRRSRPSEAR